MSETTGPKYRLEQEDGLFRIYATRRIDNPKTGAYVNVGDRGGLVATEHVLSQDGDAWLSDKCRILNPNSRVARHALLIDVTTGPDTRLTANGEVRVSESVFKGVRATFGGDAQVWRATQESGELHVNDRVSVQRGVFRGEVSLNGDVYLGACDDVFENAPFIGADGRRTNLTHGYIPGDAFITHQHQVLTIRTPWGPCSAYRGHDGESIVVAVGCQRATDESELIEIARRTAHGDNELYHDIAGSFWEMAQTMTETSIWEKDQNLAPKPAKEKCRTCGQHLPDDDDDDDDDY